MPPSPTDHSRPGKKDKGSSNQPDPQQQQHVRHNKPDDQLARRNTLIGMNNAQKAERAHRTIPRHKKTCTETQRTDINETFDFQP